MVLADVILAKLTDFGVTFSLAIQDGMKTFYYGVSSYRKYISHDYYAAILELEKGVSSAKEQAKFLPFFTLAAYEQWYNKIRVYIRIGDIQACIKEITELFLFALKNSANWENKFEEPDKFMFLQTLAGILKRFQAEVEKTFGNTKAVSMLKFNSCLFYSLSKAMENSKKGYEGFYDMVTTLHFYYSGDYFSFLTNITKQYNSFLKLLKRCALWCYWLLSKFVFVLIMP